MNVEKWTNTKRIKINWKSLTQIDMIAYEKAMYIHCMWQTKSNQFKTVQISIDLIFKFSFHKITFIVFWVKFTHKKEKTKNFWNLRKSEKYCSMLSTLHLLSIYTKNTCMHICVEFFVLCQSGTMFYNRETCEIFICELVCNFRVKPIILMKFNGNFAK